MAVKQKLIECATTPVTTNFQIILRLLETHEFQEKVCRAIVTTLGTVHVPPNPADYKQFIIDSKRVQAILSKQCCNKHLQLAALDAFYQEICRVNNHLSPAISIVLQLLNTDSIESAVDYFFTKTYSDEDLQQALLTLLQWLCKATLTENLSPVILYFMKRLESQKQYDILGNVVLTTVEPLFKLLIMFETRKMVGPIIQYMFILPNRLEAFQKIVPRMNVVMSSLVKENSDSSELYIRTIVHWSKILMQQLLDNQQLNEPLKRELEPILLMGGCKQASELMPWSSDANLITSNSSASMGRVGLNNLGNTCYMNSVLQSLYMTKPFRNKILLCERNVMLLFSKLQVLFALLQHSQRPALSPSDILKLARPPGFLPGHQHDSSEFLGYLLDILHEQEKNTYTTVATTADGASPTTNYTIVQSAFGGRTISTSSCGVCEHNSQRIDNFRELQLSFPSNSNDQSVQTLLDYYLQPEKLCGDNQYHCDLCEHLTDGERVTSIEEAPRRLILTLKHFRYDPASQQRTKLLQSVKLDNFVYLEGIHYELYSVVVHCGSSVDSGHYYTFAKDCGEWYKFNDCIVLKTTADDLHTLKCPETPYILFYSKVDDENIIDLPRNALPKRLQMAVDKDQAEYNAEKQRNTSRPYNTRRNPNDEQPPPGCGSSGFSSNNSPSFVY